MKFREEANGDLTVISASDADFYGFLKIEVPRRGANLFKYSRVTPYFLEALREHYIWSSKPSDFNDPLMQKH
jgi:hypothetical protein